MKIEKLLLELESLCERGGFTIRKERGTFKGDQCIIEGEKLVMINKNRPIESQTVILAKVVDYIGPDTLYIKPAVRKELEKIWDRLDKFDQTEDEI